MGKIIKITEKITEIKPITLPDGNYLGTWGGNKIDVYHKGKNYELETDEGVRGIGYKVMVTIDKDDMTFVEINN
jgi:hypothetical protein